MVSGKIFRTWSGIIWHKHNQPPPLFLVQGTTGSKWVRAMDRSRQSSTSHQVRPMLFKVGSVDVSLEPLEPTPPPFASIPFHRDPTFVDRGDILNQVDLICSEPAGRVALVGLGGVGKSQLAVEFAHRIAARSADSWLSNERNGKWLMILDSADNYDVLYSVSENTNDGRPLATYLPQSQNGSIILTTRKKDLAFRLTGAYPRIIEIGPMTQEEALMLLKNRLSSLSDVDVAAELVRVLDRIPLAISQAAAYIQMRTPRSSLTQYLAEFQKSEAKRVRLLSHDAGDLRRDLRQDGGASNAILTTWQVSFDHIRSERPSAADLLSLMSFFDRQGIPESLLRPSSDTKDATQAIGLEAVTESESDDSDGDTESGFEDDIATLRDYCLIMVSDAANTFEMHGLVQLSTRRWLEAQGLQEDFKEQYVLLMASSFPTGHYENWATCQTLFAHAEAAVEYQPIENNLKEKWAGLLHNGGWYAWLQGRYAVAERMLRKARRTREERLGKENAITLESISLFAMVLSDKGLYEDAEKLNMQVMDIRKMKLGADHPDTLTSMANLASTFWKQGRLKEAEKLEVQVVETLKMKLGTDHPHTLTSMANLASTYRKQGRWKEAEKLEVHVLETLKMKLGADHPDTLTSMANLASTYRKQGRWEEAEKLDMEVMKIRKMKLGKDHPDTLTSMANLASTFWKQGRLKEAEKLIVQAIEMSKKKLGEDHPNTLTSMANLASTFWKQGRWEEAVKLQVQVMEACKMKLGADHPYTLTYMANLASMLSN
ncbi:hypothetical protein DL771_005725 [Monosporascus sp. 5C6A]|nr:hypothetical protein DL771_005725 [Monosporascus sp. 5C6A]